MQHVRNDLQRNKKRLYHEDGRLQHVKNIVSTPIYNICNIKKQKKRRRQVLRGQRGGSGGRSASSDASHPTAALAGGRPADGELMSL
jgi:hypothetical protein